MAKKSLAMKVENSPRINNLRNECIYTSIPLSNEKLHILLVYIHVSSAIDETIFIKTSLYPNSIIIGDFNHNNLKPITTEVRLLLH